MTRGAGNFATNGYLVVRSLLPESLRSFLHEYALKSARNGRLRSGDPGVPNTPCCYSDALMESLLEILLPRMEAESGLRLYPTYSYFRVYKHGDVLGRHKDRPSCEISVTVSLGYEAGEPWPIFLEDNGMAKSFQLAGGDGLLYRGIDLPHWRDYFAGVHAAQVFLHYVDQGGPNAEWIYDKRKGLGTSPVIGRIVEQFKSALMIQDRA